MADKKIKPVAFLKGELLLGGDKSISHRAIILSSLSVNTVKVKNFYPSQDCLQTLRAMRKLGVKIKFKSNSVIDIQGVGLNGLSCPKSLFLGDSGTSYRLLAGLVSGIDCQVVLKAGEALSHRPMKRIVEPLTNMGAEIKPCLNKESGEAYPPLLIKGGNLKAIRYSLPVASAQVKSAILLAGLYARGQTQIVERISSRDHTERMLARFKANISIKGNSIYLCGSDKDLRGPGSIYIPGDFSSAAFFILAALLLKGSRLTIKSVNINPTRIGLLEVLKRMNANIKITKRVSGKFPNEPMADIRINYSRLKGTLVKKDEIPLLIDEVPVLMVAASLAKGRTRICGVSELRVKETDRIRSMVYNLKAMGADIKNIKSGKREEILIKGVKELKGAALKSFSDHRTAMSVVIASLAATSPSTIDDISCIGKSFPDFFAKLESIKSS